MFILRQASLKMAILLHTVANWRFIMIIAVNSMLTKARSQKRERVAALPAHKLPLALYCKILYFLKQSTIKYNTLIYPTTPSMATSP